MGKKILSKAAAKAKIKPGQWTEAGAQANNIQNLMGILSSEEATNALTEMGKIDKKGWKMMGRVMTDVKEIVKSGGLYTSMKSMVEELKQTLIDQVLAPFTPIIEQFSGEFIQMFQQIMPIFVDVAQSFSDLMQTFLDIEIGGKNIVDALAWVLYWTNIIVNKPIEWIADIVDALVEAIKDIIYDMFHKSGEWAEEALRRLPWNRPEKPAGPRRPLPF